MNANKHGLKTGEICGSSVVAVLAIGLVPFSVVKAGFVNLSCSFYVAAIGSYW